MCDKKFKTTRPSRCFFVREIVTLRELEAMRESLETGSGARSWLRSRSRAVS